MTNKATEDHLYKRTTKRIGLFDSGVGGLSVLRHLVAVTQGEGLEFVYLGDAARCPYGSREKVEIATFVDEDVYKRQELAAELAAELVPELVPELLIAILATRMTAAILRSQNCLWARHR